MSFRVVLLPWRADKWLVTGNYRFVTRGEAQAHCHMDWERPTYPPTLGRPAVVEDQIHRPNRRWCPVELCAVPLEPSNYRW